MRSPNIERVSTHRVSSLANEAPGRSTNAATAHTRVYENHHNIIDVLMCIGWRPKHIQIALATALTGFQRTVNPNRHNRVESVFAT